jgi:RNA polymerase sigma-54 factor
MALEQKLSLKLAQKLVMTPSLQQAIKLLQMTRMELETLLSQELVENPILEEVSESVEEEEEAREGEVVAPPSEADKRTESLDNTPDLDAYFNDDWDSSSYSSMAEERDEPPIENTLTREADLCDHLLWQLHMAELSPREREIGELIIGNLDTDGFLQASVEEICELTGGAAGEVACTVAEVEEVLRVIQTFDPPGIACRDLPESLLLQLAQRGVANDSLACRMVAESWDLFLKRQFPAIARRFGVELPDLEEFVELIRGLEVHPGRKFNTDRPHYIEPDVYVRRVGMDYVIQLNDDGLPRLRVSRAYRKMLQTMQGENGQNDAKQFIREKMRSAVWLIKSLDQRQRTIYKVADSIVRQQREFLDKGMEHLRPMVLRDVAEDIGMHESTVSRVVSNKYIHTHRGVFPMKFFFHSGINREYSDDISSLTVKRKIEQLIDAEDPKNPLSDSELMRILNREGIQIARRTVAKYRDELGIPSSSDRKKIF